MTPRDCARYTAGLLLRVLLRLPLQLLASMLAATAQACEQLADGLWRADRMLRQHTVAPYVRAWNRELAQLDENARRELLRRLRDSVAE